MKEINYKKILVTHDGSKLASAAIPHAISLALACKAKVLLLHVVNSIEQETALIHSSNMYPMNIYQNVAIDTVKQNSEKAKQQLEKIKDKFETEGITKVKIYVEEGSAQNVILDIAKTENMDLIIISTHGRSGLGRILLGSVADHVIRHALCPVLVIHPNLKKPKGGE